MRLTAQALALAVLTNLGGSAIADTARPVAVATPVNDQATGHIPQPRTFVVDNVNDNGPGSLRWAILDANDAVNAEAPDRIVFAIPGVGPHAIRLASPLPAVRDAVLIDGFTQAGSSPNSLANGTHAKYMVELDGSMAGPCAGILIQAASTTIRGFAIHSFSGDGIRIEGGESNRIESNLIGGEIAAGGSPQNGGNGLVIVDSRDNRVGGAEFLARNEIVGNGGRGVLISGRDSVANSVLGNRISGNRFDGIVLESVAPPTARSPRVVPNNDQAAPVLVSATRKSASNSAGEGTLIEGRLLSLPLTAYRLELFSTRTKLSLMETQQGASLRSSPTVAEGDKLVGSANITTDADGRAEFQLFVPQAIDSRASITATVTDPSGNTSEFSAPVQAPLVSKSWNNAAGGNWNVATNWTPNGVPTATDDAVITLAGTYTVTLNVSSQVASLTLGGSSGTQTLSIAAANTLTLDGASTVNSFGALSQSAGTIAGAGNLVVNGSYNWSGGTHTGTGVTTLNGAVTMGGSGSKDVTGSRTVNLVATTTVTGTGALRAGTGGVMSNSGTLDVQSTAQIANVGGGSGTFNNSGTIRKTVGTGALTVQSTLTAFNNTGSVVAQVGSISIEPSGTHTGGFNGSGGTVQFNGGTHNLNAGASFAGDVRLVTGTLNVNTPITTTVFNQSGGFLQGTSTFTTTGLYTWNGGDMTDAGITNANGGMSLGGSVSKNVRGGRTLNNTGTATQTGTTTLQITTGAVVNNSGTWDWQSDADIASGAGGGSTFNNTGIFKKSGGTAETLVSQISAFNNTGGSVLAEAGKIVFGSSVTSTGSFSGASGTVEFRSAAHNLNAGTTLAGSVELTGGTLNVNAPVSAATFLQSGGTLQGAGTFTVSGLYTWQQGDMAGTGITNANGGVVLSTANNKSVRTGRVLNNSATATWSGAGTILVEAGATINNSGTWDCQSDVLLGGLNGTRGSFNNLTTGTFKKTASTGETTVNIPLTNAGAVEALSGRLNFTAPTSGFTQTSGSTTLNGGDVVSATTMEIQGGTFGGAGTATGRLTSSGQVVPGLPLGILNQAGDYTQSATGVLNIQVGGLTPGTGHDQLNVSGVSVASLAGTLNVTLANGFVPVEGNSTTIMTFPSRTGTFANVTQPGTNCVGFYTRYDPTAVVLDWVALPTEVRGQLIAANKSTISWSPVPPYAGTTYEVLRGRVANLPVGPGGGDETCIATNLVATQTTDATTPTVGTAFWYQVRERVTGCGLGTYGRQSNGTERVSTTCP